MEAKVSTQTTTVTVETIEHLKALEVLSVAQVKQLDGLSESTIRRAIAGGSLAVVRLGSRVMIPQTSRRAWLGLDAVPVES